MKNIIIIGARGYHSPYGGFETFVSNLIDNYKDDDVRFYIPEYTNNKKNDDLQIKNDVISKFIYMKKFSLKKFMSKSIKYYKKYIKKEQLENVIIYILGSKIGLLSYCLLKKIKNNKIKILYNPDGIKNVTKKDKKIIKISDCIVCDSKITEKKINNAYDCNTTYISYGAYQGDIWDLDEKTLEFIKEKNIKTREYYLVVGRFLKYNNYELIINEFMNTSIEKDLVIVSDIKNNKYYKKLKKKTNFNKDSRIKFVGTIYDDDILRRIRRNAKGYIHGNANGGTNPSLLEAMSITDINIVFDTDYNREVGQDTVIYFNKEKNNLKNIIENVDKFKSSNINNYSTLAKNRIQTEYTWDIVVKKYKKLFDKLVK